jgi:hypothetical protein
VRTANGPRQLVFAKTSALFEIDNVAAIVLLAF